MWAWQIASEWKVKSMTDSELSRFSLSDLLTVSEQHQELTPETREPGAVRTTQPLVLVHQNSCRSALGVKKGECNFSACLQNAACWEGVCAGKVSVDRMKEALLRVQTNVCFYPSFYPFNCSGKCLQWVSYRIPLVFWSVFRWFLALTRLCLRYLSQVWNLGKKHLCMMWNCSWRHYIFTNYLYSSWYFTDFASHSESTCGRLLSLGVSNISTRDESEVYTVALRSGHVVPI